ncbi:MAG: leucine-rich repeat protein [Clostridia bacterium]|nr:leucine-rich repeat protein [Clostridia bacterium]
MKKVISMLLAVVMLVAAIPCFPQMKAHAAGSTSLGVTYRTQEEVQAFFDAAPFDEYQAVTHSTAPSLTEPYSMGTLSDETAQSALTALNFLRYTAGLNANVVLDDSFCEYTSAATMLNYLNGGLSHYPARPEVLSDSKYDALYNTGYTGASRSNIASGYQNLNQALLYGWMYDEDSSNIDRVGHRRWVLNPPMGKIGFGATGRFYAMYAFDRSGTGSQKRVAWPAQEMPVQYFDATVPWSLSIGTTLNINNVSVTLTRKSDNQTWSFSASSADGDFYVDNGGYGQTGCIIFRPNTLASIAAGDSFHVTVTGATSDTIEYDVNFFELDMAAAHAKWSFDEATGVLTVYGNGTMQEYGTVYDMPWNDFSDDITSVVIKSGVESVCENAFMGCANLTSVTIEEGVKVIGESAFENCRSLRSVTIAEGTETIGYYAFIGCAALDSVSLPASLKEVQLGAFISTGLSDVYYAGSEADWAEVYIGSYNDDLGTATMHYNAGASTFSISGSVTSYGDESETVSIRLLQGDTVVRETTAQSGAYTLGNLAAGAYTVEFSKYNHVTRSYAVTIADESVTLDAEIRLPGDVIGDGEVTTRDLNRIYAHVAELNFLTGYDLLLADVVGDDGEVTTRDLNRVYAHVSEINPLWQ